MAIRQACHDFLSLETKECTMLVLSRKVKEEIRIGNDITVTIVCVKGQSVRIGIKAPEHVHVMRSELVTPNESGTDGREPGRQRCGESASPDGGSVAGGAAADGSSRKQSRDSQSDSSGDTIAADTAAADGTVVTDGTANANGVHGTSPDVDVAAQQPQAIRADECGCQPRHSPIGSTTAFARVVARRRQNGLNQWLPPR